MKNVILLFTLLGFLAPLPCQAQTNIDKLLSLDLSYALTGFFNQGWGIGLQYEKKILDYVSVKGGFGHMTFLTGIEDVYCTTVSISLFINYYPLGKGLDKLYIGLGNGCDFINYFGNGTLPADLQDTIIYLTPLIGWKLNFFRYVMFDVSVGYKFIIISAENYRMIEDYINDGIQIGFGFKILLNRKKDD